MTITVSTEATVTIGAQHVSPWQHNLVGLLVDANFDWAIGNVDAFAAYEATGSCPTETVRATQCFSTA